MEEKERENVKTKTTRGEEIELPKEVAQAFLREGDLCIVHRSLKDGKLRKREFMRS